MSLLAEYRSSLKAIEVEELLDLFFYRPLAFLFVKGVYRTPLTPNAVTILATIAGVAASYWIGIGSGEALRIAALLLVLYNVLDCSDGMLARLQGSGSRIGRILDGLADYIVTAAFYIGIGIGYSGQHDSPLSAWALTVAAGLSNSFHSALVDFYRNRFLDHLLQRVSVLEEDLDEFRHEYESLVAAKKKPVERSLLWLYFQYSAIQRRIVARRNGAPERAKIPVEIYVRENRGVIRGWTFVGHTTELTVLICGCLAGRIDFALWTILLAGNGMALILLLAQHRVDKRVSEGRV